jgi:TetR/AcrR family transcriptional regulator, fatty acid metabolism regulator protein
VIPAAPFPTVIVPLTTAVGARAATKAAARTRTDQEYEAPRLLPAEAGTTLGRLTERSIAQEEKRRQILEAAVRVFARKGYHAARVGDIAEEAGVAHGLLYHYFASKESVLDEIFREEWGELLEAVDGVAGSEQPAREQLRQVAAIILRSWKRRPDVVRVLVREIARSPELHRRIDELGRLFDAIERIVVRGQREGSFRDDLDPKLASWIFYGGIEEILTGWVLGRLDDGEDAVAQAERTVVALFAEGLASEPSPAAAG